MALRERTNYLKSGFGKICGDEGAGSWVDLKETAEGGAKISSSVDVLEFLDMVNRKLEGGNNNFGEFPVTIDEITGEIIFVKEDGQPIAFNEVMKALFD